MTSAGPAGSVSPLTDEFEFVPATVEDCWKGVTRGQTEDEVREQLEQTYAAIDFAFNPRDDDVSQEWIMQRAVLNAARFIASLPCTCTPGEDDGPCDRCSALGRWHDERCER